MEYDILNTILTDSVGSLFNDEIVYGSAAKTPFKLYTPKLIIDVNQFMEQHGSKTVQKQSNPIQNNQKTAQNSSFNSQNESFSNNYTDQSADEENYKGQVRKSNLQALSPDVWVQKEGPLRLQEALKRLKIDLSKVTKKDLEQMSYEGLNNEKKKVKNELKVYDVSFQQVFGRFPQRQEKEPLRPLYIYYKKIKQYIQKHDQMQQQQQTNNNSVSTQDTKTAISSQEAKKILQQIEDLKAKRQKLRDELAEYQSQFVKNNNRKIRFQKDIEPVEQKYQMYKDVKAEIAKLEAKIQ